MSDVVDITILGAGPAGLAAAYYAGHRDASVRIVESLEQIGEYFGVSRITIWRHLKARGLI